MTSKTPRYALRKLTIGVTSVALGMIVTSLNVHADDLQNQQEATTDNLTIEKDTQQPYQPINNTVAQSAASFSAQPIQPTVPESTTTSQKDNTNLTPSLSPVLTAEAPTQTAKLCQDNKTETNQSNVVIAQNVRSVSVTTQDGRYFPHLYTSPSHATYLTIWQRMNVSAQFDVDAGQLKKGDKIKVLSITQNPEYYDTISPQESTVAYYNGKEIGYYLPEQIDQNTVGLSLVVTNDFDGIGMQHFSFQNVEIAKIHDGNDWSKLGSHTTTHTTYSVKNSLGFNLLDDFNVYYTFGGYGKITGADYRPNLEPDGFLSTGLAQFNIHGIDLSFDDSQGFDKEKSFVQSGGKDASGIVDSGDKIYGIVIHQPKNNTWIPISGKNSLILETRAPYVNANGEVSYDYGTDPYINYPQQVTFDVKNAGNDLNFENLEKENFVGGLYSQQSNGDYIYCYRIPRERLKFKDDDVLDNLKKNIVFNVMGSTDQALQNTLNFWHNNLKNMPTQFFFPVNGTMADQTTQSNIKAEIINVDGNQLSSPITMNADTKTSEFKANGQAQIKLRTIDAQTGLDVEQAINYVEWPNPGKTAQFTVPNVSGYRLVTDSSRASQILKQLNISGTPLTSTTTVNYPGQNQIDTYYFVMEPATETATVNLVDQDSGQILKTFSITGQLNAQISQSNEITNAINSLKSSGKYDLASNDLDNHPIYQDGNKVYQIKFKHHLDSTTRHYRVIENLPNETQKVIMDLDATLYKDAASANWTGEGAYLNNDPKQKMLKKNSYKVNIGNFVNPDDQYQRNDYLKVPIDKIKGYNAQFRAGDNFNGDYKSLVMTNFDPANNQIYFDLFYRTLADSDHLEWTSGPEVLPSHDFYIDYTQQDCPTTFTIKDGDTGDILYQETAVGKYGDKVTPSKQFEDKLKEYENSDKYIPKTNPLNNNPSYSPDNPTYDIVFTHKVNSVNKHYRVIEDLPDGTQKTVIDLTATLYQDANSNVWQADGAHVNGTGALLKQNEYHINTGIPMQSNDGTYLKGNIDIIPGYTAKISGYPNNTITDGLLVSVNNSGAYLDLFNGQVPTNSLPAIDTIHISYEKNQYPVVINYYDTQGNLISTNTQKHYYLDNVKANTIAPKNYILLAGQKANLTVGYDINELDLIVTPKINYTTNQSKVTRTIHIVKPNGDITTIQQEVNFSQTIGTNAVTHQIVSQSKWTPVGKNYFSAYSAPVIDGYTATNSAQSQEVQYGHNYNPIYLTYEKNTTVEKPKYIDIAGNTYDQIPQDYQIARNQTNNNNDAMLIIKQRSQITIPTDQRVTRTVIITMPNGRTRTVKQTAFKGTDFNKVSLPVLHGYKVVINGNIGKAAADKNMTTAVTFKKI